MSSCNMYFDFYLTEPISIRQVSEIYQRISDLAQSIEYTCLLNDMVSSTYDMNKFAEEHKGTSQQCNIILDDEVIIILKNLHFPTEFSKSRIRNGERQLRMVFLSKSYDEFPSFIDEEPEYCRRLVPLVSIVAEVSNAYFGIYGSEVEYTTRDRKKDRELSDIEFFEVMLDKRDPTWATFYLDNQLFDDIGPDAIGRWAEVVNEVGDKGKFIERHKTPLCGSKWEVGFNDVDSIFNRKNEIYHRFMFPKIIKRIRKEYHYDIS